MDQEAMNRIKGQSKASKGAAGQRGGACCRILKSSLSKGRELGSRITDGRLLEQCLDSLRAALQ